MTDTPRILNMRPDPPDLRDRLYNPTLRALEPEFNARPFDHPAWRGRVRDQGKTSACTGFALAAMVESLNFKCWEARQQQGEQPCSVSPFMLYYFARRYDELRGSDPEVGSTARGAMKSWHKHGVCRIDLWPKMDMPLLAPARRAPKRKRKVKAQTKSDENWVNDAFRTPLGAYYRVDHLSIADLHAALSETGVVYATAQIHEGWKSPQPDGRILNQRGAVHLGGHAFLLVGYDTRGFWIQNSWGQDWGRNGFAHLAYTDWLENGMDAWIGQLGVYVTSHMDSLGQGLRIERAVEARRATRSSDSLVFAQAMLSSNSAVRAQQINPYIVNLENNGKLSDHGRFRTSKEDLHDLALHYMPNALDDWELKGDDPIDIALYAHGGLVSEDSAAETAAQWIPALYANKIFPIFFMWETGLLQTINNILSESLGFTQPAAGGFKDRLLDFVDDRLEGLVAPASTPVWEEIKENALHATTNPNGGMRLLAKELNALPPAFTKRMRFHLIGHSAGAVFHAHLLPELLKARLTVQGLYLMAPACRVDLFQQNVLPAYEAGKVLAYTQFHLSDKAELDDNCASLYNRSLLYLVSNACERKPKTPILGMEKFAHLIGSAKPPSGKVKVWDFISAPTASDASLTARCRAASHSAFDNDHDTVRAILERIKRQAKD
jgi:Papain family cysteine protease